MTLRQTFHLSQKRMLQDFRDLSNDLGTWKFSWRHLGETVLDGISLVPLIGAIGKTDEIIVAVKRSEKVFEIRRIARIGSVTDSLSKVGSKASNLVGTAGAGMKKMGDKAYFTLLRTMDRLRADKNMYQLDTGYGNLFVKAFQDSGDDIDKLMAIEPTVVQMAYRKTVEEATDAVGNVTKNADEVKEIAGKKLDEVLEAVAEAVGRAEVEVTAEIAETTLETVIKHISDLKNVSEFRPGALEHILEGELNTSGKAVGFHYEGFPTAKGKIIPGTETAPNSFGAYQAKVEVNGIPKTSNGGYSSFFFKNWNSQQIVDAINEAFANKVLDRGNAYIGYTKSGMSIMMYIDSAGKIISAFPIV